MPIRVNENGLGLTRIHDGVASPMVTVTVRQVVIVDLVEDEPLVATLRFRGRYGTGRLLFPLALELRLYTFNPQLSLVSPVLRVSVMHLQNSLLCCLSQQDAHRYHVPFLAKRGGSDPFARIGSQCVIFPPFSVDKEVKFDRVVDFSKVFVVRQ